MKYAVITTISRADCYYHENWMADKLFFIGNNKEECLDFVRSKGYSHFLTMDGHTSPAIAEVYPDKIKRTLDLVVKHGRSFRIFWYERDAFYAGEVLNVNGYLNHDAREWRVSENPLSPKVPHKYDKGYKAGYLW